MNEVGVIYVTVMPTTDGLTRQMNQQLGGSFDSSAKRGESSFGRMFRRVAAVGATILATIGLGKLIKSTVALGVEYNTLEQTSRAAFTTILGSADAATKMMDGLREFAKTSPFPRQAYISAAQQMAAFGIQSKKVVPYLDAITDAVAAAGGSGQQLSEISFIMAQISAAGKITGQDLIQFGQRGINAAELIGSQMGKTGAQIREDITDGAIGADEALDALAKGMAEKFDGAAENVKNTWLGSVDRIKGAQRDIASALIAPFIDPEGGGYAVRWANIVADTLWALKDSPGLTALQGKLRDLAKSLDPFIRATGEAFKLLGEENGWQKFVDAMSKVSPLFGFIAAVAEELKPVLPALADGFAELARALLAEGVIESLTKLIVEVLPPLVQLLTAIAPLVPPLANLLAAILVPAADAAAWWIDKLSGALDVAIGFLSGGMGAEEFVKSMQQVLAGFGQVTNGAFMMFKSLASLRDGFIRVFSGIADTVKKLFSGQFRSVKDYINSIIDAVNGAIRGINGALAPIRRVMGIGVEFATIPRLAESGTILPRPGGTLILAAEAGRAESVVDTGKLNALMDAARNRQASGADGSLLDALRALLDEIEELPEKFARKLEGYSRTDRRGWAI